MVATKPIYRRVWFWLLVSLVLLVVIVAVVIDPLATSFTRKGLAQIKGFDSDFEKVSVSILRLSYRIEKLKLTEKPVTKGKRPTFYAEDIEARLLWRDLIKFHLVGTAQISDAKINASLSPKTARKAEEVKEKVKKEAPPLENIDETLEKLVPFKIARVAIRDSEILFILAGEGGEADKSRPQIWVHDLELSLENFANRRDLEGGKPVTMAMRAILQRSGVLSVFVTADPLTDVPSFAGQAELKDFKLKDLHQILVEKADLKIPQGRFDCFVSFKSEKGKLTGGVKPMLKEVEVEAADKDLGNKIKAALADKALDIFSDNVPGRDAVATTIPIKGSLREPDVQLLPTVLNLVRNAFVEGLATGFSNVPPPEAEEKEGVFQQIGRALSKDKGPARAQPEKRKD